MAETILSTISNVLYVLISQNLWCVWAKFTPTLRCIVVRARDPLCHKFLGRSQKIVHVHSTVNQHTWRSFFYFLECRAFINTRPHNTYRKSHSPQFLIPRCLASCVSSNCSPLPLPNSRLTYPTSPEGLNLLPSQCYFFLSPALNPSPEFSSMYMSAAAAWAFGRFGSCWSWLPYPLPMTQPWPWNCKWTDVAKDVPWSLNLLK